MTNFVTSELEHPTLGALKIEHWHRYPADQILAALKDEPIIRSGNTPPVFTHVLGRQWLAVRKCEKGAMPYSDQKPRQVFESLKRTMEKRLPVLEVPVAFISTDEHEYLVTLWRRNMLPFSSFSSSSDISLKDKITASESIMREVAKLHATGFKHRHLHFDNFLVHMKAFVAKKGKPAIRSRLIDPTKVISLPENERLDSKKAYPVEARLLAEEISKQLASVHKLGHSAKEELEARLNREYDTHYIKVKSKLN